MRRYEATVLKIGFAARSLGLMVAVAAAMATAAVAPTVSAMRDDAGASRPLPRRPAPHDLLGRIRSWDALSPGQRQDRRARYDAWRALPAAERASLRATAAQVASFDPAREQALRAQFAALDQTRRRAWRLGPDLGRDFDGLHPLLAYVPQAQLVGLRAMLRTMPAEQRADLAVLAQRTPPQDRNALREQLLALPLRQRARWLQQRLAR